MRNPSFHAALMAGASLLLISGVALAAEAPALDMAATSSIKDTDVEKTAARRGAKDAAPVNTAETLLVDRADWVPDHAQQPAPIAIASTKTDDPTLKQEPALMQATPAKAEAAPKAEVAPKAEAAPTSEPKPKKASRSESGVDPEPDEVTTPAAVPSHDPLDRPKTGAAKSGDAAKPGAAKPDANKPDDKTTKQAEEPLPPVNAAIKAALDKRDAIKGVGAAEKKKERAAVAFFYASHGFAPAWSQDGKAVAAVEPILARLAHADEDALDMPSPPKALTADGTAEAAAESDIALTEAVVSYARQATGSRVDPHAISPLIGARPDLADPAEVLDSLVGAGSAAGDKLQALNPSEPRYLALRKKLAEQRAGRSLPQATTIPPGPTLRIGMHDDRVPALRSHFGLEAPVDIEADDQYDKALAAAVSAFQRANGLPSSGKLTKATVAALSGEKPAHSEGQIIANMEMWRWMPRDLGADRIEVNVPDYMVTVFHDGASVAQNRVVVGKFDTPTPLFSNTMKFLIVNPVWNVPQSIIENEMGGEARAGFTSRYVHGRLYIQQPPGPKNALGRIKFMFPNPFSVYLHDTPAKHLFSTAKRAYSHGCVRVDKPFDFAEAVLNDGVPEGGKVLWSQQQLEKMLGNSERYVDLPKPLPIHIEYFTARVDDSGNLTTKDDIYGYTGAVAAALGHGGEVPKVALPKIVEKASDRPRRRVAERRRARDAYDDGYAQAEPVPAPAAPAGGGLFGLFPF